MPKSCARTDIDTNNCSNNNKLQDMFQFSFTKYFWANSGMKGTDLMFNSWFSFPDSSANSMQVAVHKYAGPTSCDKVELAS